MNCEKIIRIVANHFQLDVEDIKTQSRKREVLLPRQIAMYFCKEYTAVSLRGIGSRFGDKHHATVLHSYKTINNLIDTDKRVRLLVADIREKVSKLFKEINVDEPVFQQNDFAL